MKILFWVISAKWRPIIWKVKQFQIWVGEWDEDDTRGLWIHVEFWIVCPSYSDSDYWSNHLIQQHPSCYISAALSKVRWYDADTLHWNQIAGYFLLLFHVKTFMSLTKKEENHLFHRHLRLSPQQLNSSISFLLFLNVLLPPTSWPWKKANPSIPFMWKKFKS